MDFCDENFHLHVTQENAVEMFQLAKRHRLLKAEANLRYIFSKLVENLIMFVICLASV